MSEYIKSRRGAALPGVPRERRGETWAGLGWAGLGWAGLEMEMAGFLSGVFPLRGPVGGHADCVTTNTTSTLSVYISTHTPPGLKIETLPLVYQVPRDEDSYFLQDWN